MVEVIWTESAIRDLDNIYDFIFQNSPKAALRQIENIILREKQLIAQPLSGQIQILENIREEYRYIVEGNYKIIYHKVNQIIYVDAIFDTRQDPVKMYL